MRRVHAVFSLSLALALSIVSGSVEAQAVQQTPVAVPAGDPPSIFTNGYQGMMAGATVGLAAGYLKGRRDDWQKKDWRAVGLGVGIGALAGAGLGITLGILDRADVPAGRYIARDLLAGAGFGAVVGALSGGISALISDDAEHVLFGTAVGVVAGAGVGIITGIIEGQTKKRRMAGTTTARLKLEPSLGVDKHAVVPGVLGRF